MISIDSIGIDNISHSLNYSEYPDHCPFCHHSIKPIILQAYIDTRISDLQFGNRSKVVFKCPRNQCDNIFIGVYEFVPNTQLGPHFYKPIIYPVFPGEKEFSEEIKAISPDFVKIYNQALAGEQYNLDLIVGPGYRKSLEFLIKDYAIKKVDESKKEEILNIFLGEVINRFIDDPRIKAISKRATWLGNDETHYLRKWVGKDLDELKTLIELTVRWIEMSELSDRYEKEMPD